MRNFSNRKKIDYIGNTNIKGTLMQIFCQYLHLHMKIICWRFHIKTPTFWDMRMWNMWKVCLQTFRNNKIWWKLAYFLTDLSNSRANNSRILRIKNAKFSGYCFDINTNIYGDFQICISVPLIEWIYVSKVCWRHSIAFAANFEQIQPKNLLNPLFIIYSFSFFFFSVYWKFSTVPIES